MADTFLFFTCAKDSALITPQLEVIVAAKLMADKNIIQKIATTIAVTLLVRLQEIFLRPELFKRYFFIAKLRLDSGLRRQVLPPGLTRFHPLSLQQHVSCYRAHE